jgi:hypothetical protein
MGSYFQAALLLRSSCLTVGKAKGAVAGSSAVNGIREETACLSSINKSVPFLPNCEIFRFAQDDKKGLKMTASFCHPEEPFASLKGKLRDEGSRLCFLV